jgi:hypothetical protein
MPKRAKEMSARAVAAIKDEGRYAAGGVKGLYLHVRGVSRCWLLRVKVDWRRREFGLGSFPEISLAIARDKAWERRRSFSSRPTAVAELPAGPTEPSAFPAVQKASRETSTFEACARTYVAAQAPGCKSGKHAKQWLATLETYAFPVIGKLDVAAVAVSHVLQIVVQTAPAADYRGTNPRRKHRDGWPWPSTSTTHLQKRQGHANLAISRHVI